MMNENSPIWARLKPAFTAVLSDWPDKSAPRQQKSERPATVTTASSTTAPRLSSTAKGATSMPTETKNTAPNRSLSGLNRAAMRGACTVPARIDPAMNAPRAEENPMLTASAAMPKHSAIEATSSISSLTVSRMRLRALGTTMTLSANHMMR